MQRVLGKNDYTLRKSSLDIGMIVLLIGGLLLLRDLGGVSVNKYLYLVLVAIATFLLPIEKVVYLISFLMPLYVGMPGNYMTIVFLVRFLPEIKSLKVNVRNWVFCILAGGYALVQALYFQKLEIPNLIFFPSMILVMLLFSLECPYSKNKMLLYYAVGTAIMGLIMLTTTLQQFDLDELLVAGMRLGDNAADALGKEGMSVVMDPNFYGMLVIPALAAGTEALLGNWKDVAKNEKILLIAALATSVVIALIGLSRAFFLVLIIWAILYALSRKKAKALVVFILVTLVAIFLVSRLMPDVLDAILNRFTEDKTEEGGGRMDLIRKYGSAWQESLGSVLLGTSIFDCNVHCTPLQILFGGGIVFTLLFVGFVVTLPQRGSKLVSQTGLQRGLPVLMTILISLSVPALMLINSMYPFVVAALSKTGGTQDK